MKGYQHALDHFWASKPLLALLWSLSLALGFVLHVSGATGIWTAVSWIVVGFAALVTVWSAVDAAIYLRQHPEFEEELPPAWRVTLVVIGTVLAIALALWYFVVLAQHAITR